MKTEPQRRLLASALLLVLAAVSPVSKAQETNDALLNWRFYVDELEIESTLIFREGAPLTPEPMLLRNVVVIDLPDGKLLPDHAVLLRDGFIEWLGPQDKADVVPGVRVIDGEGRFLAPGLIEMHAHTLTSSADYLTQLGAGVTTIREMDGFPWLLRRKRQAQDGVLFAPTMFVTGTILNGSDFGGYARAVNTPEEARQAVREQATQGYDAIKIHNSLNTQMFDAILSESAAVGLDVVGHNPQPVPVAHVLQSNMRTAEHLKGYIDDGTLKISTQDWVTPSRGAKIYLAPTFMAYREHLRGSEALAIVNGEEGELVHPQRREQWRAAASQEVTPLIELRQSILPMQKEIFLKLKPLGMNWIAGTDSGSYNNFVPGPALIGEVEMFESLGMSPLEALRTATTTAAEAMRWGDRVGRIAPGLQADLILLEENPLESSRNLRSVQSVVMRGILIEDASVMLRKPATVWNKSKTPGSTPTRSEVEAHLAKRQALKARGYSFNHFQVAGLSSLISDFGYPDLALEASALNDD